MMGGPDPAKTENAVHGTVVGPSVQAGSIHGDLHFHTTPATPPVVPRQLVAPPAVLVGRDAEIAELERLRRRGNLLIVLTGLGGAGKTFLARRWAHDLRTGYPDGQLFIDLNGFSEADPVDPGEALTLFLRAVGIDPATLPTSLPALAGLFRSWTADRSMLIVLDNALSAAQVRALLPASPASLVLVTSRSRLTGLIPDGAAIVHVGPLSIDDSVALMSRVIGRARVTAELPAAGETGPAVRRAAAHALGRHRPTGPAAPAATDAGRRRALRPAQRPPPAQRHGGGVRSVLPDAPA